MSNQATLIEMQQLWWLLKECKLVWAGGSIQISSFPSLPFCAFSFTLWLPSYTFAWVCGTPLPNLEWCTKIIFFEGKWRCQHPMDGGILCIFSFRQLFPFLILPSQIHCIQGWSSALKIKSRSGRWSWVFWFGGWLLGDVANHRQSQN